jgi:hypothetical protein
VQRPVRDPEQSGHTDLPRDNLFQRRPRLHFNSAQLDERQNETSQFGVLS